MMIQLLTLLFLISPLTAHPPTPSRTPETHTALLHYLHRRNIGCYSGCQSCSSCGSSCSSSCNSCVQSCPTTCQTNCQICQQPVCQQSTACGQCCNNYCTPIPLPPRPPLPPTTTTTTNYTIPTYPTYNTTTVVVRPPTVINERSFNNTVDVNHNVNHTVTNYLRNENRIHVPININNVNKVFISNKVDSRSRSDGGSRDPIISTTTTERDRSPTTTRPTDDHKVIIITIPYQGHYIHPVVDLPCVQQGYSCNYVRPSWSGNICGGWTGYGSHWGSGYSGGLWSGYGAGLDWGGFSGCRTVSQNCGACGPNFYNSYSRNSWQYSSCYGCFI